MKLVDDIKNEAQSTAALFESPALQLYSWRLYLSCCHAQFGQSKTTLNNTFQQDLMHNCDLLNLIYWKIVLNVT